MTEKVSTAVRAFIDQYHRDGSKAVTLCSDVTLFLDGPPNADRHGILQVYDAALQRIESAVTFVKNGESARFRSRPKDLSKLLPAWFERGGPDKGSYCLWLESGATAGEPSDRAFDYSWILGKGYIRLVLPAELCLAASSEFQALAAAIAAAVRFRWGTAGLGVNIHEDYTSTSEDGAFARIGQRFSGVDLGQPQSWRRLTETSIKTVNWLTFLGHDHLARAAAHVGGEQTLAAELGTNVAVTRLPHGVMIQAGAAPGFGDTTHGETLPEYRQVARALRGLKIPPEVLRTYDGIGGTENTRKWLNRFD